MTYTAGRLWEEVVYVAYYLHWSLAEILDLPHSARTQVIEEVGKIHSQVSPPPREVSFESGLMAEMGG